MDELDEYATDEALLSLFEIAELFKERRAPAAMVTALEAVVVLVEEHRKTLPAVRRPTSKKRA